MTDKNEMPEVIWAGNNRVWWGNEPNAGCTIAQYIRHDHPALVGALGALDRAQKIIYGYSGIMPPKITAEIAALKKIVEGK